MTTSPKYMYELKYYRDSNVESLLTSNTMYFIYVSGYPDAVCRVNRCGSCKLEWYNGRTGNMIQCSGCIDRSGIERGEGMEWPESDCETCSCQVRLFHRCYQILK